MDILADEAKGVEPKQCRTCGAWLPATTEYFARDKKGKDGLLYRCKSCSQKASQKYKAENREKILAGKRRYREEKHEEVMSSQKRWRSQNKEKEAKSSKLYREKNYEFVREINRRYELNNPHKAMLRRHKRRSVMLGARGRFTKENLMQLGGILYSFVDHVTHLRALSGF